MSHWNKRPMESLAISIGLLAFLYFLCFGSKILIYHLLSINNKRKCKWIKVEKFVWIDIELFCYLQPIINCEVEKLSCLTCPDWLGIAKKYYSYFTQVLLRQKKNGKISSLIKRRHQIFSWKPQNLFLRRVYELLDFTIRMMK